MIPAKRHFYYPPLMPDVAEWSDVWHPGHTAAGVRYTLRAPGPALWREPLQVAGLSLRGCLDMRLVRTEGPPFTIADLAVTSRYSSLIDIVWRTIARDVEANGPLPAIVRTTGRGPTRAAGARRSTVKYCKAHKPDEGTTPMLDTPHWSEADSAAFIVQGRVFTPERDEVAQAFLDLTPAEADDEFTVVDLAAGAGWLTEAYLRGFPRARAIALDGSETMRRNIEATLSRFADRLSVRPFELAEVGWERDLPPARAIVSSLAVHHLDGPGKRDLYARLFKVLEPKGALLIFDLATPASPPAWRYAAREWDRVVERQSHELTGSSKLFDEFRATEWNYWEHPDDPMDKPSSVVEHTGWLTEAGFSGVDVFRSHAGHVLYGGYRPA